MARKLSGKLLLLASVITGLAACSDTPPQGNEPDWEPQKVSSSKSLTECAQDQGKSGKVNYRNRCEFRLFEELSRIYRPSGEEQQVRKFIQELLLKAVSDVWKISDETLAKSSGYWKAESDSAGNMLIRVPGTRSFARQRLSPIALQAPMDMVLAVAGLDPAEDMRPLFKSGVLIEETSKGWFQSKDNKTTLGADAGIGVALALRYLLNPALEHPPLELVFTSGGQLGMKGAADFKLRLRAKAMINLASLDYSDDGAIYYGSPGAAPAVVAGTLPSQPVKRGQKMFQISQLGLLGGHSDTDIALNRMNAIHALGQLLGYLQDKYPETALISAASGARSGLNKIANTFSLSILLPPNLKKPAEINLMKENIKKYFSPLVLKFTDEDLESSTFIIENYLSKPTTLKALTPEGIRLIAQALTQAGNGVIEKDPSFPDGVRTSSNLGYFSVQPEIGKKPGMHVEFGFLARSFSEAELAKTNRDIQDQLVTPWKTNTEYTVDRSGAYPPWPGKPDSWLLNLAQASVRQFRKRSLSAAGLEPSYFSLKFPAMPMISIGADIRNSHTVNEKVRIRNVEEVAQALDQLLVAVGRSAEFRR